MQTCTYTYPHAHAYTLTCTHARAHTRTHTHMHKIDTHIHTHNSTNHAQMLCMHVHIATHTYSMVGGSQGEIKYFLRTRGAHHRGTMDIFKSHIEDIPSKHLTRKISLYYWGKFY